jgi:hypothetical protein
MLLVLYQMASGGGPSFVRGIKDASQDARPVGGMGAISGTAQTFTDTAMMERVFGKDQVAPG